ncbi:hypothetical protein A3K34_00570 [candidate division WWE3 bacterium RIFOXYC1_FULL_40_10]|nr:MAG: hypothetical protein A3K58_00570 [candidate division WWE3 bacterium RIFOXYB1_FULL_40_22]OGC61374.1 MAG: hypothetical protein A3K37_00570 [candidate division WWE3 bacterium RIFOXYA1_FULL_40_11]OGC65757.1 MAG: hypothetical protein A3K34_00570 [candidate division WWE3 bacterium RIFOXYC1_FULL_40_10]OGC67003.1 MAG: hypothetical protein A2450_03975 [candidate division WWE3 bacterium RIFOXYC2_FULL_40_11]OGC70616.1 MAG: hypothetical protein A2602_03980 [candidate division WWE3 bacterium RIFOXYD
MDIRKFPLFETLFTLLIIFSTTTVLYLYTSGYRINRTSTNTIDLSKTGMISAKSLPEGATVFLDGKVATATNDTISGIEPGKHRLKIVKKGFVEWEKELEVFPELVTDITAVLISQTPRIEPLTNTGISSASLSNSMDKVAYTTSGEETNGVWVMQIGNYTLSIFRPNSSIVLVDTTRVKYSGAKSIEWSYDDKNLIIEGPNGVNYMADLVNNTAETTTSPQIARDTWISELDKKRTAFVEKIDIPDNVRNIALSPKSEWSPDQKKFMYTVQSGDMMSYYVYNLEKPLPIGENRETTVMSLKASDPQPKLVWYPDSYHFVVVEGDILNNKKGTISLVRIDGTNKTEIYNNTLYSDLVFSSPSGDRILIITSFKSSGQTDLYSVSIR